MVSFRARIVFLKLYHCDGVVLINICRCQVPGAVVAFMFLSPKPSSTCMLFRICSLLIIAVWHMYVARPSLQQHCST